MAEKTTRDLFPNEAFEFYQHYTELTPGSKGILDLPIGSNVMFSLSGGVSHPSFLLLVAVSALDNVTVCQLNSSHNVEVAQRPIITVATDENTPANHVRLFVNYRAAQPCVLQHTNMSDSVKPIVLDGTAVLSDTHTEAGLLTLGVIAGFDSNLAPHVKGGEVYHPANLPPIATPDQAIDPTVNDHFLTPASVMQLIDALQGAINQAKGRVCWVTRQELPDEPGQYDDTLHLYQCNHLTAHGVFKFPAGTVGDYVFFAVPKTLAQGGGVFLTSNDGSPVVQHGKTSANFGVKPSAYGSEFRAFINENGLWEVA